MELPRLLFSRVNSPIRFDETELMTETAFTENIDELHRFLEEQRYAAKRSTAILNGFAFHELGEFQRMKLIKTAKDLSYQYLIFIDTAFELSRSNDLSLIMDAAVPKPYFKMSSLVGTKKNVRQKKSTA